MKTLDAYREAGKKLYDALHLATYPIAVKYIRDEKEIPDGAMRPSAFGKKMALCQAFTHSRRWGTTVALCAADNFCTPSTALHRWEKIPMEEIIESQVKQGWHRNREAETRRMSMAFALIKSAKDVNPEDYRGLVSSPLPETTVIPDVVLVYCDGVQLTHLVQALSYDYLHVPVSSFEGFGESCFKGAFIPFITGKPQVVIPGAGDRSFAGISENELAVGMPAMLLFYLMENLFKTGGPMNIGYPMRFMINMDLNESLTPGFQYLRKKLDKGEKG